jgi:hypothetical protein
MEASVYVHAPVDLTSAKKSVVPIGWEVWWASSMVEPVFRICFGGGTQEMQELLQSRYPAGIESRTLYRSSRKLGKVKKVKLSLCLTN